MSTLRTYPTEMPWAIVEVKKQLFAVATEDMREMILMPDVSRVPNVPDHIRGVIHLRGRVLPLIDLRKRMGLASAREETEAFCQLMQQREQDHRDWLKELELSVEQRRRFALTTDPHQCAFGKWYDGYHADNTWVAAVLRKFDAPHQQIHGVAAAVEKLIAAEQYEEACGVIDRTHSGVLAQMIHLFSELKEQIHDADRETAIILADRDRLFAISVDVALSVEKFPPGNIEEVPALIPLCHQGIVRRLAKRAKGKEVVLLIETDRLASGVDLEGLLSAEAGAGDEPVSAGGLAR